MARKEKELENEKERNEKWNGANIKRKWYERHRKLIGKEQENNTKDKGGKTK